MRMTQFMGLSPIAEEYLRENCETDFIKTYKNDALINAIDMPRQVPGKFQWSGIYEDGGDLPGYSLPPIGVDPHKYVRKVIYEKVQTVIWSSGPMIFTMLVDEDDNPIVQWSEYEINDATGGNHIDYTDGGM